MTATNPRQSESYIPVDDEHELFALRWGTPGAHPVIFVHGGPGSGHSVQDVAFFNPRLHDVIFWDQRGAGRSRYLELLRGNTTDAAVRDLEAVRMHFGFEKFTLVGGSWGATLGLLYAEQFPARVAQLVLRGVFLADEAAFEYFLYAARQSRPDAVQRFCSFAPGKEGIREIAGVYAEKIQRSDHAQRALLIREWARFEFSIGTLEYNPVAVEQLIRTVDFSTFALLGATYFANAFFIEEGRILRDLPRIASIPTAVVHGRSDLIASCSVARSLTQRFDDGMFFETEAGHGASEPRTQAALADIMQRLAIGVPL